MWLVKRDCNGCALICFDRNNDDGDDDDGDGLLLFWWLARVVRARARGEKADVVVGNEIDEAVANEAMSCRLPTFIIIIIIVYRESRLAYCIK